MAEDFQGKRELCYVFYFASLGQRLSSASLPARQHNSLNSIGKCVCGTSILFVQGAVDRHKKLSACENCKSTPSSSGQFRHRLCRRLPAADEE